MSRRLRAFKRWMRSQGIECSDALQLTDGADEGIAVKAVCNLMEGDLVATIPKRACLTIKTSAAREIIEAAGLEGYLGLSVALMYEKSLGEESLWAGYLQLLPERECLPFVWTLDQVDTLLSGTELQKGVGAQPDTTQTVKEDKAFIYEDWKECILPLIASSPLKLNPNSFGIEQYFAAKSLIASRSFEIDDYHGFGMVPLADLFNHKTGAEAVHFTSVSSHSGSDNDIDDSNDKYDNRDDDKPLTKDLHSRKSGSSTALVRENSLNGNDAESSSNLGDEPLSLQMIIVKDVKAGAEVFNTYGIMGNAALLHRYGFTEPDNAYDIVNIDLNLVLQWSSSLFSGRYSRARLSLWKRLDCSGCISQNSEYFEISSDGEPQTDLLILLYIFFLSEEAYHKLNHTVSSVENINKLISILLLDKSSTKPPIETLEMCKDLLLTDRVCDALMSLADIRESFFGLNSVEDDIESLRRCCHIRERKLYHSLMLRVSERRILEKLRIFASSRWCKDEKSTLARKRLKMTS
ncbi:hypothetical protein HHK36_004554 [Tetracentron sinense]|uniref:N-lysine methyltransferase n=1 Tax=Tetracentron sinense TaxID=13715 RepID=A0A834ZR36_TETSI|nr:hypothetical protein HHK36_004554 [Tetracentron sinense]